jgi:hypothetical protein
MWKLILHAKEKSKVDHNSMKGREWLESDDANKGTAKKKNMEPDVECLKYGSQTNKAEIEETSRNGWRQK